MASAFILGSAPVPCNPAALRRAPGFTDIPAGAGLIVRSCPRGWASMCVDAVLSGVLEKGAHSSVGGEVGAAPTLLLLGGRSPSREPRPEGVPSGLLHWTDPHPPFMFSKALDSGNQEELSFQQGGKKKQNSCSEIHLREV